jgi:hypothetical protein
VTTTEATESTEPTELKEMVAVVAPRKIDAVKAAIDEARRIQPPRGKNAKGITFGKAPKKSSI